MMFEVLMALISGYTAKEEEEISFESRLREDLGMDDSDFFMMRYSLQNTLDCDISEEEMNQMQTVMDILKFAQEKA